MAQASPLAVTRAVWRNSSRPSRTPRVRSLYEYRRQNAGQVVLCTVMLDDFHAASFHQDAENSLQRPSDGRTRHGRSAKGGVEIVQVRYDYPVAT